VVTPSFKAAPPGTNIVTSRQARGSMRRSKNCPAGRLAGQRALAKKAEVPEFTLESIEGHGRITGKDLKALSAIRDQLEAAGIAFTNENGVPGLCLHPQENDRESNAASPARTRVLT
jgi:hypothetical protein